MQKHGVQRSLGLGAPAGGGDVRPAADQIGGEFGGQTNATGYFDKVRVYDMTENGIALRAWAPLIKYSPYNELNTPEGK